MKRVQFLTALAGEHVAYRHGQITELEKTQAEQFIAAGICSEIATNSFTAKCPGCGNDFAVTAPAAEPEAKPEASKRKN